MGEHYRCDLPRRRTEIRDRVGPDGKPIVNGIDYLKVATADQKTLEVYFFHDLPGTGDGVPAGTPALGPSNILIDGGERIPRCHVSSADADVVDRTKLIVLVDEPGDFSMYTLRIVVSPSDPAVPPGFDRELSQVHFSFKVDCPSDFDCRPAHVCPPEATQEPLIDYLAKDYASFRRLMLDRLALLIPEWRESNPADGVVALVELLASAADQLSYYQDAVATEAYLGTARSRISIRRHSRLLDYAMHDGCNARAWVHLVPDASSNGATLPAGTRLLTRVEAFPVTIPHDRVDEAVAQGGLVFETMHDVTLRGVLDEIEFYTWGNEECCLPKGATAATLRNAEGRLSTLAVGDLLLFEEVVSPTTNEPVDAEPSHRHVVRLTRVEFTEDPLFPESPAGPPSTRVVEIEWDAKDALPFPLCLWRVPDSAGGGSTRPASVARGNIVLADHGRTVSGTPDETVNERGLYHPSIPGPITQHGSVRTPSGRLVAFDPTAPAAAAFDWEMENVRPAVTMHLMDPYDSWTPQRDLLSSDKFAHDFVLEAEDDGTPTLRFGDDMAGERPSPGTQPTLVYRVGNGRPGNVGAESIGILVATTLHVAAVRNPLPARGGLDPELIETVRLDAPQAFRIQERAVTEADFEEVTQRRPDVQQARGTLRWTGSWYTSFVSVDRRGGEGLDAALIEDLQRYLERFRLAGSDVEIEGPRFVPLDIEFTVCVAPGFDRSGVKAALLDAFSNRDFPNGRSGFFHPDQFTFGDSVYVSRVVAAAMAVPGVLWVDLEVAPGKPNVFGRWGQPDHGEFLAGEIAMGRLEIARLDNDSNAPEHGRIDFFMEGGL